MLYIKSVTGSASHSKDNRISSLLREHDSDKDGFLSEEDFIKFYYVSSVDSEETVWNNLEHRRYRKDLKRFN